jgi:hypothetical protein
MSEILPSSLIRKTDKGLAAIKDRDRSLQPRARTLLILVDGSKSVEQLAALNQDVQQGLDLIKSLLADGFAEVVALSVRSSEAAVPVNNGIVAADANDPPIVAKPAKDLKLVIRASIKYLEGFMGPGAEAMALQLERCKTVDEFDQKAANVQRALASGFSERRASEFAAVAQIE